MARGSAPASALGPRTIPAQFDRHARLGLADVALPIGYDLDAAFEELHPDPPA